MRKWRKNRPYHHNRNEFAARLALSEVADVANVVPATASAAVLTAIATTTATHPPQRNAWTFDDVVSGSTRSSHHSTGATITNGIIDSGKASGAPATNSTINTKAIGRQTSTGTLSQCGNRGLRTASIGAADIGCTPAVQAAPSHHRH